MKMKQQKLKTTIISSFLCCSFSLFAKDLPEKQASPFDIQVSSQEIKINPALETFQIDKNELEELEKIDNQVVLKQLEQQDILQNNRENLPLVQTISDNHNEYYVIESVVNKLGKQCNAKKAYLKAKAFLLKHLNPSVNKIQANIKHFQLSEVIENQDNCVFLFKIKTSDVHIL